MEQWITTTDTREAAAIGTLGIPTKVNTTLIEKTGERISRLSMALRDLEGRYQTGKILSGWRTGKLEADDPTHPFLTIQRAFENRLAILDLQNKGVLCELVSVPRTDLFQYVRTRKGLDGRHGEVIETSDLKLAAALGVVGLPLLAISGSGKNHLYYLKRWGPPRRGGPAFDGAALAQSWVRDPESIPWEEPFAQAMRGLYNRERYLDAIRRDKELILMRKPRSQRAALIHVDATDGAFDLMKNHFDKP